MNVNVFGATDVGLKRKNNEDAFFIATTNSDYANSILEKGLLIIVADGMGGHNGGEVASRMAVENISKFFYESNIDDPSERLVKAIQESNRRIYEEAATSIKLQDMGTTVVAAVVIDDVCYIANVGDSRCYIIRDDKMDQLTEDDSLVAELVRKGIMTEEEAKNSPQRNVITKSVGNKSNVEPSIRKIHLKPGDYLLLCTDGLSGVVEANEIFNIVKSSASLKDAVDRLIKAVKDNGAPDNVTIVLANFVAGKLKLPVRSTRREQLPNKSLVGTSMREKIFSAVGIFLLVAFMLFSGYYINSVNKVNKKMLDLINKNETINESNFNKLNGLITELRNKSKTSSENITTLNKLKTNMNALYKGDIYLAKEGEPVGIQNLYVVPGKNNSFSFFPAKYESRYNSLKNKGALVSSPDGLYFNKGGKLYNYSSGSGSLVYEGNNGDVFYSILHSGDNTYYILKSDNSVKYGLYKVSAPSNEPVLTSGGDSGNIEGSPLYVIKEKPITQGLTFYGKSYYYLWYITKGGDNKDAKDEDNRAVDLHIININTLKTGKNNQQTPEKEEKRIQLPNWGQYYVYAIGNKEINLLVYTSNLRFNNSPVIINSKISIGGATNGD